MAMLSLQVNFNGKDQLTPQIKNLLSVSEKLSSKFKDVQQTSAKLAQQQMLITYFAKHKKALQEQEQAWQQATQKIKRLKEEMAKSPNGGTIQQEREVSEVTLPKLARQLENWRGGGMDGTIKWDKGLAEDAIEMTWKAGGLVPQVLKQFAAAKIDAHGLRFAGSYQQDDTGETSAVEIVVRGRHEEIDLGNAKAGDDTEVSIKTIWSYFKLTIDGIVVQEIDIPGCKHIVDGVDILAKHRQNIGL